MVQFGLFEGEIFLQEDFPSGDYSLNIFVYEKNDNEEVTNFHAEVRSPTSRRSWRSEESRRFLRAHRSLPKEP